MKQLISIIVFLASGSSLFGQVKSHYDDQAFAPFDRYVYQPGANFHTSTRSYRMDQLQGLVNTDSVLYDGLRVPDKPMNFWRRIFHDDLLKLDQKDVHIVVNPMFDFQAGKESVDGTSTFVNSRGLFIKGNIGKHLHFYTDFIENQAVFPNYIAAFANDNGVVPGQGARKNFGSNGHDYAQATGYITWDMAKYFNLELGNGKHFIGDGHRSLLLSDAAFSYPYVKVTADFWKVKYQVIYSKLLQYDEVKAGVDHRFKGKYGVFQYLDFNIGKRASIGLFASVVYAEQDTTGYRGFDMHYLNPLLFLRPVEYALGSPDNVTMGLNAKYVAARWLTLYGQFVLGEFKADEVFGGNNWWANKQGFQLGARTFDLFGIKNLDIQAEYNQVRPYTYSHYTTMYAYGHYQQPLAHVLGANFKEVVGLLKYRYKRWQLNADITMATYGEDFGDGVSWGKDVFMPNTQRPYEYGHVIGQGLATDLFNAHASLSFLVNPRNMFNIAAGIRLRQASNNKRTEETQHVYFAIRTSLKSLYYNF